MDIPGIRIGQEEEQTSPFGDFSLLLVFGYGIHWVWVYSAMFYPGKLIGEGFARETYIYYIISLLVFFGMLLTWGVLSDKLEIIARRKVVFLVAFALEFSGTVFLCLIPLGGALTLLFTILAGVATGLGSSTLTIYWGEAYSRQSLPSIVVNAAVMLVIATCIYVTVFLQVSRIADCALTCLCPLVEIMLLSVVQRKERECLPAPEYLRVDKGSFALRLGVSSFFLGISLGAFREISLFATISSSTDSSIGLLLIASLLSAVMVIFGILLFRKFELGFFLRPMVPVIVVCLFLFNFLGDVQSLTANFVLLIGYVLFEIMMWVTYGDICTHFKISPYFVYAVGRGFLAAGTFLISFIGKNADVFGITLFSTPDASVVIVIMTAIVVGFFLMPREADLARMIKESPLNADKNPELLASIQHGGRITNEERARGRFQRKCDKVCETYLLSNREADVFRLLARGYNMARVQEELVISEGTTKTHVYHIYKKLDIHNQQELIDLIDEQEPGSDEQSRR